MGEGVVVLEENDEAVGGEGAGGPRGIGRLNVPVVLVVVHVGSLAGAVNLASSGGPGAADGGVAVGDRHVEPLRAAGKDGRRHEEGLRGLRLAAQQALAGLEVVVVVAVVLHVAAAVLHGDVEELGAGAVLEFQVVGGVQAGARV